MKTQDNQIATAPLAMLIASATQGQMERAEAAATKAMSRVADPVCGAREIVLAQLLRRELSAERGSIGNLMAAIAAA